MSKGKRPAIPAALHHEVSEYAALIRALRTSHTLDLSEQLVRASVPTVDDLLSDDELDNDGDDGADDNRYRTPAVETSNVPDNEGYEGDASAASRIRTRSVSVSALPETRKRTRTGKSRARDTWTRWPLLAGDVHVPEWGLEDEVELMASRALKRVPQALAPAVVAGEDDSKPFPGGIEGGVDEDVELEPASLHALTDDSATYLARILALLAAHTGSYTKRMQDRLRPFDWEAVLAIVGASSLVDPNVVRNVHRRLEVLYKPSQSHVVERVQTTSSLQLRLASMCERHDASLFTLAGYDPLAGMPKKPKKPYKKRKTSAVKEEVV
ncbi:uncharacterized protein FIBRA_05177 [Fibroporia radiculosa]|uniref:Uncharacterized protein n=1 Tax=Fibroporia radiculosa TaxID=599839 RepID=J4HX30_9APHY|nr:uncharacterized protein FIBRA_05177 [Fibroporia radiculosa]CCM03057.1 predicted protein [Fibroporia radiculosa]